MRRALIPMLIASCIAAAGCGGDESASDREQIASVLKQRYVDPASAQVSCEATVSERFVREVYGSAEHCREINTGPTEEGAPREVRITQTQTDGDRATTMLALVDGDSDGQAGRVALAKVDGDWKLDRFGVDFARAGMSSLEANAASAKERAAGRCLTAVARRLSDAQVLSAINALYGSRPERFPGAMSLCLLGAPRAVKLAVEAVIEDFEVEDEGLPAATRACVKRKLRASIGDDDELARAFPYGDLPVSLYRTIKRVLLSCRRLDAAGVSPDEPRAARPRPAATPRQ